MSGVQLLALWPWYSVTWARQVLLVYASAVMQEMAKTSSMVSTS